MRDDLNRVAQSDDDEKTSILGSTRRKQAGDNSLLIKASDDANSPTASNASGNNASDASAPSSSTAAAIQSALEAASTAAIANANKQEASASAASASAPAKAKAGVLVEDENRVVGKASHCSVFSPPDLSACLHLQVAWKVYASYIAAAGGMIVFWTMIS